MGISGRFNFVSSLVIQMELYCFKPFQEYLDAENNFISRCQCQASSLTVIFQEVARGIRIFCIRREELTFGQESYQGQGM